MNILLIRNLLINFYIMFIGSKKIEGTFELENNMIKVEFDDNSSTEINKELLELIQSEEKGDGNIVDTINHYFATKFVAELAMYDLGYYFTSGIATSMQVLSHNLREQLFRKTFSCTGADDINLRLLTKLN